MVRSTAVSPRRLCSIRLFVERLEEGTAVLAARPGIAAAIQMGRRVVPPRAISIAPASRGRRAVILTDGRRPWSRFGPCVPCAQLTSPAKPSPIAGVCRPTSHARHAARPTAEAVRPASRPGRTSLIGPRAASIGLARRTRTTTAGRRRPDPTVSAF